MALLIPSMGPFRRIVDVNFGRLRVFINIGSTGAGFREAPDDPVSATAGSCSVFVNGIPVFSADAPGISAGVEFVSDVTEYIPSLTDEATYTYKLSKSRSSSDTSPGSIGQAYAANAGLGLAADVYKIRTEPSGLLSFSASVGLASASGTLDSFVGSSITMQLEGESAFEEIGNGGSMTCVFNRNTGQFYRA